MHQTQRIVGALLTSAPLLQAAPVVIDWDLETELSPVDNSNYSHFDVTLSNPGQSGGYLSIYDSTGSGGEDPDLEQPWVKGNAKNEVVGNVLIIQNPSTPDDPNDSPNGGTINFDFADALAQNALITSFGFYWADMEENPGANSVTYTDNLGNSKEFLFTDLINGVYPGATGIEAGNNSLNVVPDDGFGELADLATFGLTGTSIAEVEFHLSGSGGIPRIQYEIASAVPDARIAVWPGLLALAGLGYRDRRDGLRTS